MQFTIEVGRYSPEGTYAENAVPGAPFPAPWDRSPARRYQTYTVDLPEHAVVLDALIAIREYQDQSLAVRCACRSAICGSCAMWINGHSHLACKSKLSAFTKDGKTRVESPPSMPIIRDLVCDMKPFWDKHLAVKPWLQNKQPVPPPNEEYRVSNASMEELIQEVSCISCGACFDGLRVVRRQPRISWVPKRSHRPIGMPAIRAMPRRRSVSRSTANRAAYGTARIATNA